MAEKHSKEEASEKFFNSIFDRAIAEEASDVHIEPLRDKIRIRFRIDGKLQERWELPIENLECIINRIKVVSDLEIIGKPTPQEGHFEIIQSQVQAYKEDKDKNKDGKLKVVNVRVSIFPTINGETAVLRLLNRANMLISLNDFEMDSETNLLVKKLISKNYGMLLVTGPAGSGKTSMLYSILQELKSKERNIVTLEDPVEYEFEEIRQSQIKPEQGLTFAMGMRSILRQDPDIIMIGEIRDPETAQYAMRASLMGRSVFSTVHSNSSVGIIARLIDMNVERSLIAYALNGAISKRLVRKNCPFCKAAYTPASQYLEHFKIDGSGLEFLKGKGCKECGDTGYKGRIGIFEILEIDDNLRSMIVEKVPMNILQEYMEKKKGMKTLEQDALGKVRAGETTLEEILGAV